MALTVSKVAQLAGVSVRALHHYDEIGLVRPSGRSEAGYRLYEHRDLQRLQQVLFFRELGFPLEEIGRIVADPEFDRRAALLMQRQLLTEKRDRLTALIDAVDVALDSIHRGKETKEDAMFNAFGDLNPAEHEEEARQRWGDTEAYKESARRAKRYSKKDWELVKSETERIFGELAKLLDAGKPAAGNEAMAVAEQHRAFIEKWFYPCSAAMHRGLGELYISDPRFTQNIDRIREGLAQFARDAFRANSDRLTNE